MQQQAVFEVETKGARVEVVAGDQLPGLVDPDALQVVAVVLVLPQAQLQPALRDRALVAFGKAAQIAFVQIR
ncbi:hypothetical protein D3C72_2463450 [compost metagenome]